MIKAYKDGIFTVHCPNCKTDFPKSLEDYNPEYIEEFQEYPNFMIPCPNCEKNDENVLIGINMNLPELSDMEADVMELDESQGGASEQEKNARRAIRAAMWEYRPDLNVDSANKEKELREKYKDKIAALKKHVQEVIDGRGQEDVKPPYTPPMQPKKEEGTA